MTSAVIQVRIIIENIDSWRINEDLIFSERLTEVNIIRTIVIIMISQHFSIEVLYFVFTLQCLRLLQSGVPLAVAQFQFLTRGVDPMLV